MGKDIQVDFDSAEWVGSDLQFTAVIDQVERRFLIKGHRLSPRTGANAASVLGLNLDAFRSLLAQIGGQPGPGTITIN